MFVCAVYAQRVTISLSYRNNKKNFLYDGLVCVYLRQSDIRNMHHLRWEIK